MVDDGVDAGKNGFDRRSALKKGVVAGAIAWTAPTVLSSQGHAVEFIGACTAKCQPDGTGVTVDLCIEIAACDPLLGGQPPPGQQFIFGMITQVGSSGSPCPCSASIVRLIEPAPGELVQLSPRPGNWDGVIDVTTEVTCFDRSGQEFTQTCSGFADVGGSGNCEGRGGDVYNVTTVTSSCNPPNCES